MKLMAIRDERTGIVYIDEATSMRRSFETVLKTGTLAALRAAYPEATVVLTDAAPEQRGERERP